jgi:hypothetical protein
MTVSKVGGSLDRKRSAFRDDEYRRLRGGPGDLGRMVAPVI